MKSHREIVDLIIRMEHYLSCHIGDHQVRTRLYPEQLKLLLRFARIGLVAEKENKE